MNVAAEPSPEDGLELLLGSLQPGEESVDKDKTGKLCSGKEGVEGEPGRRATCQGVMQVTYPESLKLTN